MDKMDKKPSKIMWDVPWEELMALELAKAGGQRPSHLILHLKTFQKSESFAQVIKCSVSEESDVLEPQAVRICSVVRKMWKAYQSNMKNHVLKVITIPNLIIGARLICELVDLILNEGRCFGLLCYNNTDVTI